MLFAYSGKDPRLTINGKPRLVLRTLSESVREEMAVERYRDRQPRVEARRSTFRTPAALYAAEETMQLLGEAHPGWGSKPLAMASSAPIRSAFFSCSRLYLL